MLHRAHDGVVAEMADLQSRILARAAEWVRPGGTLVYATCSLEPAEGEEQAARFLKRRPDFTVRPAEGLPVPATADGFVRTLPGTLAEAGGCDGFFVARFVRAH